MMKPIHVSIVTPCFNGATYIERAITNVLEQRVDGLEHIIIDGGSMDGTLDILRKYPHLRWISEPDSGQANALNKGFQMASGDLIGWLNGDDTYTSGAIQIAADYLSDHRDCDIVYGDCGILRNNDTLITVFRSHQTKGYEALLDGVIHTPSVFWRRRVFDMVGYLNEDLHYVMDNEFWIRTAAVAVQHHIPAVLANFHHRVDSKTGASEAEFGPEMYQVFENAFSREPYSTKIPAETRNQVLARLAWYSGIELDLAGQHDRSLFYLNRALRKHGVLRYQEIVAECVVVRYTQRTVLPRQEVDRIVDRLQLSPEDKECVMNAVRARYAELRFYAAQNRMEWNEARKSGWQVLLSRPAYWLNRGFMSNWFRAHLRRQPHTSG